MFSAKVSKKSNGKKRHMRSLAVLLVPVLALIMGTAAPEGWAVAFGEAQIFFEFNSTDLDLGLHIFFDAEAWKEVEVIGPNGDIFEVENGGRLSKIGSTEVFTESAEPPLCAEDECTDEEIEEAIRRFQARFPEGWYRFRGKTVGGLSLTGRAYLSHKLPAAPKIVSPEEEASLVNPFIIDWTPGGGGPEVEDYEVVAEMVIDGKTFVNTATLPGNVTRFTVSREFVNLAKTAKRAGILEEFKVEVIARADNLNKTITELAVFELEGEQ